MKTLFLNLLIVSGFLLSGCTGKEKQKLVKFEGSYTEKKWSIKELNPEITTDWSSSGFLTFEVNSSTTQRFELRLYDANGIRILEILPF